MQLSVKPSIRKIIWGRPFSIIALSKTLYIAALFVNLAWLRETFRLDIFLNNFHWPDIQTISWRLMLNTWDTNHYLFLSERGYVKGQIANAMYPLWPFVIHLGTYLFRESLVSAMVLSNVFSFAALLIFHAFVTDKFGSTVANKSLILLLVFPGSLFYFFPYSESLFLLLSVLVFYFVDRRHYVAASVVAFFCPLAKAIGVFIVIPLFLNVWKEWRANRLSIQYFLTVLLPFLGYATVFLVMYYSTGNPAEQFEAQGRYIAHATISKMFMPIHFAGEFFSIGTSHDFFHSPVDRLWFVLSIVGLCLLFKLDRILFFYALAITIVPAVTASFMSFTRYAAVIFPIFIAYGVYFIERRRRIAFMVTLSIMVIIHVIFAFLHMNNYWVA